MKCTSLILLGACQLSSISPLSTSPAVRTTAAVNLGLSSIITPSALWPPLSARLGLCQETVSGSVPLANPASRKLDPGIPQPSPLWPVLSALCQSPEVTLGQFPHVPLWGMPGQGSLLCPLQGRLGCQELARREPSPSVEGQERYGELVTRRESKPRWVLFTGSVVSVLLHGPCQASQVLLLSQLLNAKFRQDGDPGSSALV